jgi:hypothetical protein
MKWHTEQRKISDLLPLSNYPDEWQKALRYYGIAMRNTAFMTGESGYQHDLFDAITADPYIYVTPDDDLGFRGCLYWHPDAS